MQHKYELFLFSFHDHTGITHHLEKMALKGWMLESTGFFWRYRKAPRQQVHYAVTYFPTSSDFDPAPSDKEVMFRDFCAAAGWEHIAQAGEMQIFRSFRSDPTPLDTEPQVQVETIHKSMKSSHLKNQAGLVLSNALLLLFLLFRLFVDPLNILKYGGYLLTMFSELLLIAEAAWETVSYFAWRKRALAAAEEGCFLPTAGRRWPKIMNQVLTWTMLLALLSTMGANYLPILLGTLAAILIPVAIARAVQNHMKKRGVPGRTNKGVTLALSGGLAVAASFLMLTAIVSGTMANRYDGAEEYTVSGVSHYAYHDEMPLYMGDLADVENEDYSNRLYESGSFLLKEAEGTIRRRFDRREDPVAPTLLSYTVWVSPLPSILDLTAQDRLDWYSGRSALDYHYEPITFASWAEAAWQLYDGEEAEQQYLLRFKDHVIEIDFDFMPTGEQMATAIEKLLTV